MNGFDLNIAFLQSKIAGNLFIPVAANIIFELDSAHVKCSI